PRRSKKASRGSWEGAGTALMLAMIGAGLQGAAFALLALGVLLMLPGVSFLFQIATHLSYPALALFLAGWIVPVVGYAFSVTAPSENGAKGLGIATLAVGGTCIALLILLFIQGMPIQAVTILADGSVLTSGGGLGIGLRMGSFDDGPMGVGGRRSAASSL